MKLTESKLRRIVNEELEILLKEEEGKPSLKIDPASTETPRSTAAQRKQWRAQRQRQKDTQYRADHPRGKYSTEQINNAMLGVGVGKLSGEQVLLDYVLTSKNPAKEIIDHIIKYRQPQPGLRHGTSDAYNVLFHSAKGEDFRYNNPTAIAHVTDMNKGIRDLATQEGLPTLFPGDDPVPGQHITDPEHQKPWYGADPDKPHVSTPDPLAGTSTSEPSEVEPKKTDLPPHLLPK